MKLNFVRGLAPLCAITLVGSFTATAQDPSNSAPQEREAHGELLWLQSPVYENEGQEYAYAYRPDRGMSRFDAFGVPGTKEFEQPDVVDVDTGAPVIVPEPGTMAILAGGLVILAIRRVRRSTST